MLSKKVVYVDMDNVLVNFQSGIDQLSQEELKEYDGRYDEVPGIFKKMKPKEHAIETFNWLSKHFDTYILSTAPWDNPSAWSDKLNWVKKYLGEPAYKRLILSHHKNLLSGDYLIDDRTKRGVKYFSGKHIHFGTDEFRHWTDVKLFLKRDPLDIDFSDPDTWGETLLKNRYKLYKAVEEWELEEPISYEEFQVKIRNNKEFRKRNLPYIEMLDPDYDPWDTTPAT
jgi:5'(3')-deoxyribonucleotidase